MVSDKWQVWQFSTLLRYFYTEYCWDIQPLIYFSWLCQALRVLTWLRTGFSAPSCMFDWHLNGIQVKKKRNTQNNQEKKKRRKKKTKTEIEGKTNQETQYTKTEIIWVFISDNLYHDYPKLFFTKSGFLSKIIKLWNDNNLKSFNQILITRWRERETGADLPLWKSRLQTPPTLPLELTPI